MYRLASCKHKCLLLLLRRRLRRFAVPLVRLGDCRSVVCRSLCPLLPFQDLLEPRQARRLPPHRPVGIRTLQTLMVRAIGSSPKTPQQPQIRCCGVCFRQPLKIRLIIFVDISLARKSKQVFFSLALRNVRVLPGTSSCGARRGACEWAATSSFIV